MRKPILSGQGGGRAALLGALAFGAIGLAVAGTFMVMAPATSQGASEAATAATPAANAATPATAATAPANYKFAKDLVAAGAKGCAPLVETMSSNLMQGATEYATVSNWNKDTPDTRIVSALTGQKFGGTPSVPNGLAGVFASPHSDGKCDAVSVQVVPSPLNCASLQTNIEKNGKVLGAIVGIPILASGPGQVMLVPTGANTCIIVGVQVAYAK